MSALTEFLSTQPHAHTCATFGQLGDRRARCSCWQSGVLKATEADQQAAVAVGVALLEGRGVTVSDVITASIRVPADLGGVL